MNIHPRPDHELAIQEAIRAGLINSDVDALDIGTDDARDAMDRRVEFKLLTCGG